MKVTIAVIMILSAFGPKGADLIKLRTAFYRAAYDEQEAKTFVRSLEDMTLQTPLVKGYTGMGYFMLSKHAISPFTKLAYFKKGRMLLEQAIDASGSDVELRFLRLMVQKELPSLLNYSENIEEDRKLVKQATADLRDADLKKRIHDYFMREEN